MFLAQAFMTALDEDHDGTVTPVEFDRGFLKWFDSWDRLHQGVLSEAQLQAGINQDLSPFRGGPPGGDGFGPPPDGFGPPDADLDF